MVRTFRVSVLTSILLIGIALLFSSCAFLTGDIFPSWLSFVDASFDLRGEIQDFSGGYEDEPKDVYVEYLRVLNGTKFVAVLLFYNSTGRLVLLDPDYMRPLARIESINFSPFLAAGSNSDIVCGHVSIDPSTFAQSAGPSSLGNGSRQWLARTSNDPGYDQFILGLDNTDPAQLSRYKYPSNWSSLTGSNAGTTWLPAYPTTNWELLDADTDVTGIGVNILLRTSPETDPFGYVVYLASTSTTLDVADVNLFSSAETTGEVTGPFRVDDGYAWVTSGGPVALVRGNKGSDRLVRYQFGTGSTTYDALYYTYSYAYSEELDSVAIDTDDSKVLSFDPEGEFWFVYNKGSGRLYKLRTWWK